jgi:Mrp family chromosome partitioning ATPase
MGRMLETMKHGQGRSTPLTVGKPADELPVQDCVTDWEIAEEVPYVEVGGPNKKVESSPGLMKHAPQTAPQPPHMPVEKPKTVHLSAVPPSSVAFEPWHDAAPSSAVSSEVIAYHHPDHPQAKEYESLLTALRSGLKAESAKVLLFVGLKPNVGTSTVLLNLATIAAKKHGLRVAVIEADPRHAGLAQRLSQTGVSGLHEVMAGTLALEHAVVNTAIPSVHLLPAGKPSKKLTSGAMTWLIAWLRERFDLILVEGPCVEHASDTAVHVAHADGIYLVLAHGEPASISHGVAQSISGMGGRLCGLIHTHFAS